MSEVARKIPKNLENPFDNYLINLSDYLSDKIYKYKLTPNHLTTISLISGIISDYLFKYNYLYQSSIWFIISYFFDCFDGHYARKYNMVTRFGSFYDSFSDMTKFVILMNFMSQKNYYYFLKVSPIILVLLITNFIHLGCQEKYYYKNNNIIEDRKSFLGLMKYFAPDSKYLKYTRYLGCGTLVVIVSGIIISF